MKLWIICTGEPENLWPRRCSAGEFEALSRRRNEGGLPERTEKTISGQGKQVLIAPCASARETAQKMVSGGEQREEPLLTPVELHAGRDGGTAAPRLWMELSRLQRWLDSKRQPESTRQLSLRAEKLLSALEEREQDCILVADCVLTEALLDRARVHGYTQARSGIFRYRPWERILVTRRNLHCGGCSHNCLLTNPGCGVGRDKAARHSS